MEKRDREIYTQGLYWFTQSLSYIQSSVKPLSISLCNQSQITNIHHKEVTLKPSKPTHPFCTQQTPQTRITLTLQDFTNSFTECNLNNYKKLRQGRKHLELQYTRNPIDQFLNHSKAQKQSC